MLDDIIKQLQQNFWYDIERARSEFVHSHTKLCRQDGMVMNDQTSLLTTTSISNRLYATETKNIPNGRILETRNFSGRTKIYEEISLNMGPITLEETRRSIIKLKITDRHVQRVFVSSSPNY